MAAGTSSDASVLDELTVVGRLGAGSNSTVLEVEQPDGLRLALKVVSHFWLYDARDMLDYERQILSSLPQPQHPGVIRLRAEFVAAIPESIEEHLDGEMREQCEQWVLENDGERPQTQFYLLDKHPQSLHEWSAKLPLPLPYPLLHKLSVDLLGAVAYLTECRVVHLDCKADNVLMAEDGRAVLSDFGIARQTPTDSLELPLDDPSDLLLNRLVLAPEVLAAHEAGTARAEAAKAANEAAQTEEEAEEQEEGDEEDGHAEEEAGDEAADDDAADDGAGDEDAAEEDGAAVEEEEVAAELDEDAGGVDADADAADEGATETGEEEADDEAEQGSALDGSGTACVLPLAGQGVWAVAVCLMESAVGWSPFPRYPELGDGVNAGPAGFGVGYAADAGTVVNVAACYPPPFRRLLRAMLSADPALRPTPAEALATLASMRPVLAPPRLVHVSAPGVAVRRARPGQARSRDTDAAPSSAATDPVTVIFSNVFGEREAARVVRLEPLSVALLRTSARFRRLPPLAGASAAGDASLVGHDHGGGGVDATEAPLPFDASSVRQRSSSTSAISTPTAAWRTSRAAGAAGGPSLAEEADEDVDMTDGGAATADAARATTGAAAGGATARASSSPDAVAASERRSPMVGASKSARHLQLPRPAVITVDHSPHVSSGPATSPAGAASRRRIVSSSDASLPGTDDGAAGILHASGTASSVGGLPAAMLLLQHASGSTGLLPPPGWRTMVPMAHSTPGGAMPPAGLGWTPEQQWQPDDGTGADSPHTSVGGGTSLGAAFEGGDFGPTNDAGLDGPARDQAAEGGAAVVAVASSLGAPAGVTALRLARPRADDSRAAPPSPVSSSEWATTVVRPVLMHGSAALDGSEAVGDLVRAAHRATSDGTASPASSGSAAPRDGAVSMAPPLPPRDGLDHTLSGGSCGSSDGLDSLSVWVLPPAADACAMSLGFARAVFLRSNAFARSVAPALEASQADQAPTPGPAARWEAMSGLLGLAEDSAPEDGDWRVQLRAVQALALSAARAYSIEGAAAVVNVGELVSLAASFASAHGEERHVLGLAVSTMRNCSCITDRASAERMAAHSCMPWAAYALGLDPDQAQLADDAVQLCSNLLRFDEVLAGPDAAFAQVAGLAVSVMEQHRDTPALLDSAVALSLRLAEVSEGAVALAQAGMLHAADVVLYEQRRDRDRVAQILHLASTVLAMAEVRALEEPFSAPDLVTRCLSLMEREAFEHEADLINLCVLVVRNAACVALETERAAVAASSARYMGVVRVDEAMERFRDREDVQENGRCAMFNLLIAAETRAAMLDEASRTGGDDGQEEGEGEGEDAGEASPAGGDAGVEHGDDEAAGMGDSAGRKDDGDGTVSPGSARGSGGRSSTPGTPMSPAAPIPEGYSGALEALPRLSMLEAQQQPLGPRRPAGDDTDGTAAGLASPGGPVAIPILRAPAAVPQPPSRSPDEAADEASSLRRELGAVRKVARRRLIASGVLGTLLIGAIVAAAIGFVI